jgi:hypothetical protein
MRLALAFALTIGCVYRSIGKVAGAPNRICKDQCEITQQFDPDALVVVKCGPDGAPGVAGRDDDANGIVDDASELGASRSDDVCEAIPSSDDSSEALNPTQPRLVLQHGAFVDASQEDLRRLPNQPPREIVVVESEDGQQWTYVRD